MNFYNGYSPAERIKKLRASYKVFPNRSHPLYSGPCQLCGNPSVKVEPHSEDYSEPYLWENPAEYAVCKTCHKRLHTRFTDPMGWEAYKLHVKRGGYGVDLKTSKVAREVKAAALTLLQGEIPVLPSLRPFSVGDPWWDRLTVDPESLTSPSARPRP